MIHDSEKHDGDEWAALRALAKDFSAAMLDKLKTKRCEAWEGWDSPGDKSPQTIIAGWGLKEIRERILEQLRKPGGGDPVDIANYCAFWWNMAAQEPRRD